MPARPYIAPITKLQNSQKATKSNKKQISSLHGQPTVIIMMTPLTGPVKKGVKNAHRNGEKWILNQNTTTL
jgi:hypothetical protein